MWGTPEVLEGGGVQRGLHHQPGLHSAFRSTHSTQKGVSARFFSQADLPEHRGRNINTMLSINNLLVARSIKSGSILRRQINNVIKQDKTRHFMTAN